MNSEVINNNMKYPEIASEMEKMLDEDQDMRERAHKEDGYWDHEIDNRNTKRMKEIIEEIGFPTISKVGKEGSHTAWLLIQHADRDVLFQEQCLELMKSADPSDVILKDIAYLEDRIRLNHKQPQLYGTQFNQVDGRHVPLPIEDIEKVNERRTKMGMDTLDDQIALMYKKYPLKK